MSTPRYLLSVVLCLVVLSATALAQNDFSFVLLPDIQNETQYYPQVLNSEIQWITNSQQSLNIQAVLGLGDITNNGSDNSQWINADAAIHQLDLAQIPYFLAIGNHDYDNLSPQSRSTQGYNQWFGAARYDEYPWYVGNYNDANEDFYGVVNINGTNYLFLVLEFVPRDPVVNWAASVIAANPDKEVFLITHSFLYTDGTRVDQCDTQDMNGDNYGDKLWTKLVSQYPNIDMVVNGHLTNAHGSRRADLGIAGNLVNQMFSNYQLMANGGDGYFRILTFHPATNTIDVKTYSPTLNTYMTDDANQFTMTWHAQPSTATTGTISGLVRDAVTCKRIPGVQVAAGTATALTDTNGHYSLILAPGPYTVNAAVNGYNGGAANATVSNGYDADTNFFLTAAPSSAPCMLDTASPSVTICTPGNNTQVTSPVTITAGTTDSNPVSKVQLFVDGKGTLTQSGATFNSSTSLTPGSHRLTVQAYDSTGTIFKQTIYATVQSVGTGCTLATASPSVTICSPAHNATVTSPLTVTAGATDSATVSYIQLYVDGKVVATQQGGNLNTTLTLTAGAHRLTVQAKDSAGVVFKQTINVTD